MSLSNKIKNRLAQKVMRRLIFAAAVLASVVFIGCGNRPVKNQHKDADVSSVPQYNFSLFKGTVWKTRVKIAMADIENYTGRRTTSLLGPSHFDSRHPQYSPPARMQLVTVLPSGAELRIDRLMKDTGNWGGLWVEAILFEGTATQTIVSLDPEFFGKNVFVWEGWSSSTNWEVNPEILERR